MVASVCLRQFTRFFNDDLFCALKKFFFSIKKTQSLLLYDDGFFKIK